MHRINYAPIGTNYAGPTEYWLSPKKDCKAYILLFAYNLCRTVHLKLTSRLTTQKALKYFKKLVARKEKLRIIYPDNAKTFEPPANWKVNKDEWLHEFLLKENIRCKFNLSSALWWINERLIGITKWALYKAILTYMEVDLQHPILTPSSMLLGRKLQHSKITLMKMMKAIGKETKVCCKVQRYGRPGKDGKGRISQLYENDIIWHTRQRNLRSMWEGRCNNN